MPRMNSRGENFIPRGSEIDSQTENEFENLADDPARRWDPMIAG